MEDLGALLLILALALLALMLSPRLRRGIERSAEKGQESAQEVLSRRYATGEITKEQFQEMQSTLIAEQRATD